MSIKRLGHESATLRLGNSDVTDRLEGAAQLLAVQDADPKMGRRTVRSREPECKRHYERSGLLPRD